MKKNKMIFIPLILPLLAFLFWGVFFWKGEKKFDKMTLEFTNKKINGIISKSNEKNRGFHLLEIYDKTNNSTLSYSLPKSWFFKENKIQVGDSVSKEANSKIMIFYKNKNGTFEKCCEYEIGM